MSQRTCHLIKIIASLFLTLSIFSSSFALNDDLTKIKITSITAVNDEIPQASGITYLDGKYYVISDDKPFLFILNKRFKIIKKVNLSGRSANEKKDFEAIAITQIDGSPMVLVLASGHKAKKSLGYLYNITSGRVVDINLNKIYGYVSQQMSGIKCNIEGLAISATKVYLANRKNNTIITFNGDDFFRYFLKPGEALPEPRIAKVTLPEINHHQAALTGLSFSKKTNSLAYTAAVELKGDVILGSFIGIIELEQLDKNSDLTKSSTLFPAGDKGKPLKIESMLIRSVNGTRINAIAVNDNDKSNVITFEWNTK
jgi:hypothetical protein